MVPAWGRENVEVDSVGHYWARSFVSAESISEQNEKCYIANIYSNLNKLDLKITNLINQIDEKNLELQDLYHKFEKNRDIDILKKILKLNDEILSLEDELAFYRRQEMSLNLIEKYSILTPRGLEVLYSHLPREQEIVRAYVQKIHPIKKNIDLGWLIAYYQQAGELTFDEYIKTDIELQNVVKHIETNNSSSNINDILKLLNKKRELNSQIHTYAEERDKLIVLYHLIEKAKKQKFELIKTGNIEPLAIHLGGIHQREECDCSNLETKRTLPGVSSQYDATYAPYVTYTDFRPSVVWIGMYSTDQPYYWAFWGDFCTYEFPETRNDIVQYWMWAIQKAQENHWDGLRSIQVKMFYEGHALNTNYQPTYTQEANIIWQFDCNQDGCWAVTNRLFPLENPDTTHYYESYKLYVNAYYLGCCTSGDVGSSCKWANKHCYGCFAPDESASQNFAICVDHGTGDYCG